MGPRVVQWATGSVGVAAIKGVLEHPELELVGCWVYSEAKSGVDVGEIIGTPPLGVITTNSVDEILALDADAVIYAPLMPSVDEVAALLHSGKNVVTPLGWVLPDRKGSCPTRSRCAVRQRHAARCRHRPGRGHRTVPAVAVGDVHRRDFRSLRGLFRLTHLRCAGCAALCDGFRGHPRQCADRADAKAARRRLHAVGPALRGPPRFAADPQIRTSQEVAVATARSNRRSE